MSQTIAPMCLRGALVSAAPKIRESQSAMGVLAAACIAAATPTTDAKAQGSQLPALTVEAPAAQKPKPKKKAVRSGTQSRGARPATQPVAPAQQAATTPTRAADANPFANAGAPFKVERVSSNKITQPLANTPRTIVAIPKEVLEDKAATSLRELVRTTPGLTLGSGEGGNAFGDRVLIRGFDARNDMFIDGVRDSSVSMRETFMAEQVEVTKGPSGSIAGRGTAGGAINVATKKPANKNFYNFSTTYGFTDFTKRITADINQVVTPQLAVRGNAMYQNAEVAGRNASKDDRWGGAIAIDVKPSDKLKIGLDYYHVELDQMPDWGIPFNPLTHKPMTESGLSRKNFYGIQSRDFQKGTQDIATGTAEYKFNDKLTLTNKLRHGETWFGYVASKPGTPNFSKTTSANWTVTSSPASRDQRNQILANQTDLTTKFSTWGAEHTLVAGIEASRERITIDGYAGLTSECNPACPGGNTFNLWDPQSTYIIYAGTPVRNGRPRVVRVDSQSYYALDTINIQDKLILTGGIRLDNTRVTNENFLQAQLTSSAHIFNYNGGITWKPWQNVSLYAAYGTSSNPVGSELDGSGEAYGGLTAQNVAYKPEKNTSLEAGTKVELFDKRLMLSAALFQTTKDNAREQVGTVLTDSAAYEVRGIELGVGGNVTDRWSVFGGAVFMETETTKSRTAANIGLKLANIAHQSFNILTKYQVTDALTIGGQATYQSEIFGGTLTASKFTNTVNVGGTNVRTITDYNRLPEGWRFDILAEYKFNEKTSAKLQVNNVLDTVLYDAFYRSASPYTYLAPGRSATLTLNYKF